MFAIMLLIPLGAILVMLVSLGLVLVDVMRMGPAGQTGGGAHGSERPTISNGADFGFPTFVASATTCTRMSCKRRVVGIRA